SEAALGEVLERLHARDRVYIASKLPHYLVRRPGDMERIFTEELRRLRTDHIDYYLMHMLTDVTAWERMKSLGIEDWLAEKQRRGSIGQVGFSYHGGTEEFLRLLEARDWDFCQIQYNYMDEHTQAGRRGLEAAQAKGIPVVIMEPLRGGKLVKLLPKEAKEIFASYPVQRSPAEWAFRWLWNQAGVTVVLSGMNTEEMVRENVRSASEAQAGDLGEAEEAMLRHVAAAINAKLRVGCTGCGYCMPCPHHVDIPGTFAAWNRCYSEGRFWGLREHIMDTALRRESTAASNCVGCGACEAHCPQHIAIRKELAAARKDLEGPVYQIARRAVRLVKAW
ncbi:MAG: aldo/keto reductase, partial [Oscillibacter sp.]|nr:aldo/keto reductase [Oscillibacter sp.]